MEWAAAMPGREAGSSKKAGENRRRLPQNIPSQNREPIRLNIRCSSPALLAFLLAPTEAATAVTQVPIFCPMIIGMAAP